MKNQSQKKSLYLTFYIIGVISGLALTALSTWADLEAAYYGFSRRASARLNGFSCPILMTANESSVISLKLSNTTDGKISPTILVETSSPATAFEFTEHVELAAGESLSREWHVGPENLDLKRFIFARALVYSAYPFPDRETTCGIFILKLPGSGTVIAWGTILLSLLGMGGGLYGVYQARGPEQRGVDLAQQLTFLSLVVLLGLVTAFMGWWIFGILALVISLLFVLISAGILIGRSHA